MRITTTRIEQPVSLVILHLDGTLDGSNYQTLINKARQLFLSGTRDLILDLEKLVFISSAGLGAIHQVALIFQGKSRPASGETWAAYRWAAYRNLEREQISARQQHIKLLSPTRDVRKLIDLIGFDSRFEIYTNLEEALESFRQVATGISAGRW